MSKLFTVIYGLAAYLVFFAWFLYAVGFMANFVVPKSIDSGPTAPLGQALFVDLLLVGLFAVQHSVMARQGFKAWWTRIIPAVVERSTYVLLSSALLFFIFWQWQPLPGVVWSIESRIVSTALWAVFCVGWATVFLSAVIIDHFDLFGLRQVYLYARGKQYTSPVFKVAAFYKYVRHPLLVGFIIAFWATPLMTIGHLLFAIATTAYMRLAIQLEERDLAQVHGGAYEAYRRQVPMLVPRMRAGGCPIRQVGSNVGYDQGPPSHASVGEK